MFNAFGHNFKDMTKEELKAKVGIQIKMDSFVLLRSISLIGNILKSWRSKYDKK